MKERRKKNWNKKKERKEKERQIDGQKRGISVREAKIQMRKREGSI